MDLSILLLVLNEKYNVSVILRAFKRILGRLPIKYEIIVVDGRSSDGTVDAVKNFGDSVRLIIQEKPGYGEAMRLGLQAARGDYIMTMDADLSHDPQLLPELWQKRLSSEIVIGSRYIHGGGANMPWIRYMLSRLLNLFVGCFLSLPFKDLSSGYRLYRTSTVKSLNLQSVNFEIQEEILIKVYANGGRVEEVPMFYRPRKEGKSKVQLIKFAFTFLMSMGKMWKLRNSIECGDYDDRAYDSRIPLQRHFHRKRVGIIKDWAEGFENTLEIGCGSGRLIGLLESGIFLDIEMRKLRYARKFGKPLVNASITELPFKEKQFDCVICSEVIEHLPASDIPYQEIKRILKPGGRFVLSTPDYGPWTWKTLEKIYGWVSPGGYAHEHITRYTQDSLRQLLHRLGFKVHNVKYVFNSVMILLCTLEE